MNAPTVDQMSAMDDMAAFGNGLTERDLDRLIEDRAVPLPPAPAEACSDLGFENEPSPRRARMGGVHGLERWFLHHPTATTVGVLVLVGLAYLGTA